MIPIMSPRIETHVSDLPGGLASPEQIRAVLPDPAPAHSRKVLEGLRRAIKKHGSKNGLFPRIIPKP